jgi:hypothetical protein
MNHILAYDHVLGQSDVGELTREIDSWRQPDGVHVRSTALSGRRHT